jgi:hypothetical protein
LLANKSFNSVAVECWLKANRKNGIGRNEFGGQVEADPKKTKQ